MGLLRKFDGTDKSFGLIEPEDAVLGNWGSQLNSSSSSILGTHHSQGVNPANGVVFYYYLPEEKKETDLTLLIKDKDGNLVRSITSKADPEYLRYPGGPSPKPLLSKKGGLNRFVWDMRHTSLPGIPTAYIEGSFKGHKAKPSAYTATLRFGDQISEVAFKILPNRLYEITPQEYQEMHAFQSKTTSSLTDMHNRVNQLKKMQNRIFQVLKGFSNNPSYNEISSEGKKIVEKLKKWDEEMVQRKSKSYDDVENFPNKFTAEYLFLINQNDSDLPRVSQASKNRLQELEKQWKVLKDESDILIKNEIPAYNKLLWDAGIGAIK